MTRPALTILMTTYFPPGEVGRRRLEEALRALTSWRKNLQYDGALRLHVGDDGSDPAHMRLFWEAVKYGWPLTFRSQERGGVGASLNKGIMAALEHSPLMAMFVDDWELLHPFDLTAWADWLLEDESLCAVRFFPHPALTGTVEHNAGRWGLRLDRHHFAWSHRPALWHNRLPLFYGWHPEGVNAYECERIYNERFNAKEGWTPETPTPEHWPDILLALPSPFDHRSTVELGDVTPVVDSAT